MHYRKGIAYILTALFLAAAVVIGAMEDLPETEEAAGSISLCSS